MSSIPEYIDTDQIGAAFTIVPFGTYKARLTSIDIRDGQGGKADALLPKFTIVDGDYEGEELMAFHNMAVYPPKPGSKQKSMFAPGLGEIKANILAGAGASALPAQMPTAAHLVKKMYYQALGGKVLTVKLYPEPYTDKVTNETKQARKVKVIPGPVVSANDSDDMFTDDIADEIPF
jgi:hypothetical protein